MLLQIATMAMPVPLGVIGPGEFSFFLFTFLLFFPVCLQDD
jgi:hypothetical protein